MSGIFRHIGFIPFTSPRTSYNTTGGSVSFRYGSSPSPRRSAHITMYVYQGTALVSLTGERTGPFIELGASQAFDFPVETTAVYIKAKTGTTQVGLVAAIHPLEKR